MQNAERKTQNEKRDANRESLFAENFCSACGALIERESSKFCRVCGKLLGEDYQPLDTLRASYKLQGRRINFDSQRAEKSKNLFEQNENSASSTAWAFAVYSLVPYLGIIFCPFAVIVGIFGMLIARRRPYLGGNRVSTISVAVGIIVFAIQILLWLLLYLIPKMGRQI